MFDSDRPVLGIDPGLSRCGYGAVARNGAKFEAIAYGVLRTDPKSPLPDRLAALEADLEALVAEIRPGAVAVERVLFQVNARTAISVGQASGLALAVAARAGVAVVQYSPNEVKLAVTGDGAADKVAVQTMVTQLLALPRAPQPPDAADALALALCHSWRARIDGAVPHVDPAAPSRLQAAIAAALGKGLTMIGSIRGTVLERTPTGEVLVEVGGVGYRASVPSGTLAKMLPGEPAFLFTHLHVREDAMVLFGFLTRDERDTFEALLVASGVGPKLALAILGVHTPNALRRVLMHDDLDSLVLVPGVGKRTAQRLLVDLKAKLSMPDVDLGESTGPASGRADVREALTGLGYSTEEVREVLASIDDEDAPVEVMLREALRQLRPSRA